MKKYQHAIIEEKIKKMWEEKNPFETPTVTKKQEKAFVIPMFPYPSGDGLHTGHVRIYTGTDIVARYLRLTGKKVLHAIGWDAFGLPAEQAALKKKINPMELVPKNITNFRRQIKDLGFSYDFAREANTTDPRYYGFTQWIFLQLFKLGLAFKKEVPVWYCEGLGTVLSDEEIINTPEGPRSERGNFPVEKKILNQWTLKITKYAEQLLEGLNKVDWPEGIKEMQRNWIGKSAGAALKFTVAGLNEDITVFTTRPDTLFGVSAIVIAPEHALVEKIITGEIQVEETVLNNVKEYVQAAKSKQDLERTDLAKEKTGIRLPFVALHPLTKTEIPIFIGDYVLGWYGHGAVMVVPAHDERDFAFAQKFNLDITYVIKPSEGELKEKEPFTDEGIMIENYVPPEMRAPEENKKLTSQEFRERIIAYIQKKGIGMPVTNYKLRDWVFSRQRYWGEPFPLIYCQACANKGKSWWDTQEGQVFVAEHKDIVFKDVIEANKSGLLGWFPDERLPVELPKVKSYEPTGDGTSPLAGITNWVNVECPHCGGEAKRETDTMPNWAGSCWYFLYYCIHPSLRSEVSFEAPFSSKVKEEINSWMPVDWYLGGAEHAVLHLLYARFWTKVLHDLGLVNTDEPFMRLKNVGMVLGTDGRKMSKSLGNIINPDEVVKEYGADALRLYVAFMAPFSSEIAWNEKAIIGCYRFLQRVHTLVTNNTIYAQSEEEEDESVRKAISACLIKVLRDVEQTKFNTCVAYLMECLNTWEEEVKQGKKVTKRTVNLYLQALSLFAPFLAEYLWQELGNEGYVALSVAPKLSEDALVFHEVNLPIQVNGRLRASLLLSVSASEAEAVAAALNDERVRKYVGEAKYRVVYKAGKILNFIVS